MKTALMAMVVAPLLAACVADAGEAIVLGSKKFTESFVLAEIAKRSLEEAGFQVEHRQGMGGTIILWEALRQGSIAAYPEYTGTIQEEILKRPMRRISWRVAPTIGPIRNRHYGGTRVQQHLRPGDDQGPRQPTWHSKDQRPVETP